MMPYINGSRFIRNGSAEADKVELKNILMREHGTRGGESFDQLHGWTEVPAPVAPDYDRVHERIELVSDGTSLTYEAVRRVDIPSVDEFAARRKDEINRELETETEMSNAETMRKRTARGLLFVGYLATRIKNGETLTYADFTTEMQGVCDRLDADLANVAPFHTAFLTAEADIDAIVADDVNYPTDDEKRTAIAAVAWSVP
jgi:hypothetical protein